MQIGFCRLVNGLSKARQVNWLSLAMHYLLLQSLIILYIAFGGLYLYIKKKKKILVPSWVTSTSWLELRTLFIIVVVNILSRLTYIVQNMYIFLYILNLKIIY